MRGVLLRLQNSTGGHAATAWSITGILGLAAVVYGYLQLRAQRLRTKREANVDGAGLRSASYQEPSANALEDSASVMPSMIPLVLELARRVNLYALAHVASDVGEATVRGALEHAGLLGPNHGQLPPHRLLFCGTREGKASMVRQLEPQLHIDADAETPLALLTPPQRTGPTRSGLHVNYHLQQAAAMQAAEAAAGSGPATSTSQEEGQPTKRPPVADSEHTHAVVSLELLRMLNWRARRAFLMEREEQRAQLHRASYGYGPARTPLASGHLERLQGGHRAPAPGEPYSSPATDFISRVSARLPHPSPAPSSQASSLSSLLSRLQELVALQAGEVPPAEVVADPHARVRFEAQLATPSPFLQMSSGRGSGGSTSRGPPPSALETLALLLSSQQGSVQLAARASRDPRGAMPEGPPALSALLEAVARQQQEGPDQPGP
ncbi:Peroxisome biogenesis protein 22 [Auxenochlorella protothecoides]|uniref:Peroxisome biogenesis protein 22 n=1 Tax=Auxenochlorella protothecoides TaxID=3075 RepID=A0A087SMQ2_AUXPR|nr:Peroxisome biogenesis protein 22 [Auxenochlorella protothecoides]KFM27006.1 Peroxisome biogenesis protein 22 [Auxenochlorella protothecoides]